MSRLPFDRGIFWKVFLAVMGLLVLTFYLLFKFSTYQLTNADRFGSLISATILSYLLHLWLLPSEYDDEEYDDEEYDDDAADEGPEDSPEHQATGGDQDADSGTGTPRD